MQHPENWLLLIICSFAGLLMVAGSFFLLWKRLATLSDDGKGGNEVNFFGKIMFKTGAPVLMLFFFGMLLLAYPVYSSVTACVDPSFHSKQPFEIVRLKGKLGDRGGSDLNVQVLAIVKAQPARPGQEISLAVPYVRDGQYFIRYINKDDLTQWSEEAVNLEEGKKEYPLSGADLGTLAHKATAAEAPKRIEAQIELPGNVSSFK